MEKGRKAASDIKLLGSVKVELAVAWLLVLMVLGVPISGHAFPEDNALDVLLIYVYEADTMSMRY